MIDIVALHNDFKNWVSNNTGICPAPADIDAHFTTFTTEDTSRSQIEGTYAVFDPATQSKGIAGSFYDEHDGTFMKERVYICFSIMQKSVSENSIEQLTAINTCHGLIRQWVRYIRQQSTSGGCGGLYSDMDLLNAEQGELNTKGTTKDYGWYVRIPFVDDIDE